jgi:hypothetical protein
VSRAESDRRQARVDVAEVVVVVGDAEVTGVLGTVAVRVADERSLPLLNWLEADYYEKNRLTDMVMELGPRYSNVIAGMGDVKEAIIVVLVPCEADGRQITVVNPDLGSEVESNQIGALGGVVQLQVAYNDIANFLDAEATIGQT